MNTRNTEIIETIVIEYKPNDSNTSNVLLALLNRFGQRETHMALITSDHRSCVRMTMTLDRFIEALKYIWRNNVRGWDRFIFHLRRHEICTESEIDEELNNPGPDILTL